MCEFNHENQKNSNLDVPIPSGVQQGVCHGCNRVRLSHSEMYPAGRCSRSLCQRCYNRMFNRINKKCVVCGSSIGHKKHLQKQNWREIENHLCDDPMCLATWARRHAIVTGAAQQVQPHQSVYEQPVHVDHNFNAHPVHQNQARPNIADLAMLAFLQPLVNPQNCAVQAHDPYDDPDIMDAEYVEVNPQPRAIPAPQRLQLPEPEPLMTVDSLFGQTYRQPEPEVIEIDLTRKR
jgi:hypothetical protein